MTPTEELAQLKKDLAAERAKSAQLEGELAQERAENASLRQRLEEVLTRLREVEGKLGKDITSILLKQRNSNHLRKAKPSATGAYI
jgi:septal ring factor EnvC (AmiA/AmiB activator)